MTQLEWITIIQLFATAALKFAQIGNCPEQKEEMLKAIEEAIAPYPHDC